MKNPFRLCVLIAGLLLTCTTEQFAQDKDFSQFYANPLTLNPALSGAFNGRLRLSAIYRDQWRDILNAPYTTFAGSLDLRIPVGGPKRNLKDAVGVGVLFLRDNASPLAFTQNKITVASAFHKALSRKNNQFLSVGAQIGIEQRSINYGEISFSDQFNGTDGYTDLSAEDFPINNFAYADMSAGVNYTYSPQDRLSVFIGGAIHHIIPPDLSFFNIDLREEGFVVEEVNLITKYTAHLALQLPLAERVQLLPRANLHIQGPHVTSNLGTNLRFLLGPYSGTALHIGAWLRGVSTETESYQPDALVGLFGVEYENVLFGFSYDMNLNTLMGTSTGQGAFEFSVAYLGNYENETVLCPKF